MQGNGFWITAFKSKSTEMTQADITAGTETFLSPSSLQSQLDTFSMDLLSAIQHNQFYVISWFSKILVLEYQFCGRLHTSVCSNVLNGTTRENYWDANSQNLRTAKNRLHNTQRIIRWFFVIIRDRKLRPLAMGVHCLEAEKNLLQTFT